MTPLFWKRFLSYVGVAPFIPRLKKGMLSPSLSYVVPFRVVKKNVYAPRLFIWDIRMENLCTTKTCSTFYPSSRYLCLESNNILAPAVYNQSWCRVAKFCVCHLRCCEVNVLKLMTGHFCMCCQSFTRLRFCPFQKFSKLGNCGGLALNRGKSALQLLSVSSFRKSTPVAWLHGKFFQLPLPGTLRISSYGSCSDVFCWRIRATFLVQTSAMTGSFASSHETDILVSPLRHTIFSSPLPLQRCCAVSVLVLRSYFSDTILHLYPSRHQWHYYWVLLSGRLKTALRS